MGVPGFVEGARTLDRFAPVLLDLALRSAVILGAAGVTAAVLRRGSAAARHWVWLLGFAGLLLLPVLAGVLPGWRVLPRVWEKEAAPRVMEPVVFEPAPEVPGQAVTPQSVAQGPAANVVSDAPAVRPHVAAAAAVQPVQAAKAAAVGMPQVSAENPQREALPWTAWVMAGWLGGSLIAVGYVVLGHVSLWWLQRRCERVLAGEWPEMLRELRDALQVKRAVELVRSPLRTMPMTWGLWRTRLLLPGQADAWPTEQRRAVLLHELGHVRRWDCWTQVLAQIGCALYSFNPLVWVGWRRMQVERERACDDLVLATGTRASTYAQHLLQSATAVPAMRFVGAAVAMARPSTLEERLRAILDKKRSRRSMTMKSILGTMMLLVAVLVPMACLRAQETVSPAQPTTIERAATRAAAASSEGGPMTRTSGTATDRPAATTLPARGGRGAGGRGMGGLTTSIPTSTEGPTAALDATIYEVRIPADQIGRLDINAFSQAADSAADFEKALGAVGKAVPLYRVNQSVSLGMDSISIGTQSPYVASSTITKEGVVNVPNWWQAGATFNLLGKVRSPTTIDLTLQIQVSTLGESTTVIHNGVKAPTFRSTRMSHNGLITANKPFVVLSVDASSADAEGKAVAYIARVTLGEPHSPPGRGE